MLPPLIALIGFAAALGVLLSGCVRSVGERVLFLDSAGALGHDKQFRRVPNIGGVAIFATILACVGGGVAVSFMFRALLASSLPSHIAVHLDGVREQAPTVALILGALALLHLVGLIDDRRALGPWTKLLAMLIPCVGLPALLPEARLLTLFGPALSITLTAAWLLVVTNAINYMDNMDGLAGSVAACAASVLFCFAALSEQWFIAAFAGVIVGACLGFLVYNAPPARMFMGDGGSLVLGFALAALTVLTTYAAIPSDPDAGLSGLNAVLTAIPSLFIPVAILAIPIYDFVSVSLIRIAQGKSPLVGDQQHFSHRLRRRGLGADSVVAVVAGLTLVAGVSGVAMAFVPLAVTPLLAGQVLIAVALLALLERRLGREPASDDADGDHPELSA